MIQYGDWNELDAFLVVSDRNAYLYKITAPERCVSMLPIGFISLVLTGILFVLVFMVQLVGYNLVASNSSSNSRKVTVN